MSMVTKQYIICHKLVILNDTYYMIDDYRRVLKFDYMSTMKGVHRVLVLKVLRCTYTTQLSYYNHIYPYHRKFTNYIADELHSIKMFVTYHAVIESLSVTLNDIDEVLVTVPRVKEQRQLCVVYQFKLFLKITTFVKILYKNCVSENFKSTD